MKYLLLPLFLFALACQNDTPAEVTAVETEASLATPYTLRHPSAPICPAGTNGAAQVYLHGGTLFNAPSEGQLWWAPELGTLRRTIEAEVYSYAGGTSLCRNTSKLVTWNVIGGTTFQIMANSNPSGPIRTVLTWNGTGSYPATHRDKVIGEVGPRQICCPVQAVSGTVRDTIESTLSLDNDPYN